MPRRPITPARRTRLLSGITGVATTLVVGALLTVGGVVIPQQPASAATPVTVSATQQDPDVANAPFPKLAVTVSQTDNLVSQGLEVSWTGGKKSTLASTQSGGENFLQIMQCWGDEPLAAGAAAGTAQPDRTTCQYGATLGAGAKRDSYRESTATIDPKDIQYTAPSTAPLAPTYTSIPFRPATGEETLASVVGNKQVNVDVNTNKYFSALTSNEIAWAGSGEDGSGSAKFEVQTAQQSPGLGCGTPITAADGTITGSSCWLVIVPRGIADGGSSSITQSGLFEGAWKHKLAVKLDFRPIGLHCALGASERQISGSELVAGAVASWQPKLCNADGGSIYTIATGSEADALVSANGTAPAPLALTSLPLEADVTDALAYAPVALTGLSISFAIDRETKAVQGIPEEYAAKERLPFETLNLTPRLVAKLLTNSYIDSLPYGADRSHLNYSSPADPGHNPRNITFDPDFIAVNGGPDGEWAYQAISTPSLADMLVPQGRSDAATALWTYVMADAEAVDFLAGTADEWGMVVNPWSSTDATVNKNGSAFELPRDNFPKADSSEQPASPGVDPINVVTWRPYTNDLDSGAYLILRGDGQILGGWDPQSTPPKYSKSVRSVPGIQRVIGLTDTASAAKYQVFSAALLNPAGKFVAPTTESLSAAAAAMTVSSGQSQVYGFDPRSTAASGAPGAYPLAMPVYAATNPAATDAELRLSYANFIRYAVGAGQEPGTEVGKLPAGYAPIPSGWKTQALAAATVIEAAAAPAAAAPVAAASEAAAPVPASSFATGTLDPAVPAAAPPTATGAAIAALAGAATPKDPASSALEAAVPGSLLAGLASALLVPFITRVRRRRL